MKFIRSYCDDIITEEAVLNEDGKTKNWFISGIYMQAEQKNRNKRIYSKGILESAVDTYNKTFVTKARAVGELGHPETPSINLDKVSHKIISLEWNDNNVIGKSVILDTPMGNVAKGLIAGGVQLGVSSRGLGSVTSKGGISYVGEDFILGTVDIVHDPSAPSAFVDGIMEGVDWIMENGSYMAKVRENLKKKSVKEINAIKESLFKSFLKSLA